MYQETKSLLMRRILKQPMFFSLRNKPRPVPTLNEQISMADSGTVHILERFRSRMRVMKLQMRDERSH